MGLTDDLERLAELHRSGALTDAEFASAKDRALRARPPGADGLVDGLHSLRRSRSDRWLGGVCGGIAKASGVDSWIWRLVFTLFTITFGFGGVIYLLLWIFVPEDEMTGY